MEKPQCSLAGGHLSGERAPPATREPAGGGEGKQVGLCSKGVLVSRQGGWTWVGALRMKDKGKAVWHLSESPPWGSLGCLWEGEGTRLQVPWNPGQATVTLRPWKMTQSDLQVGRLTLGQCARAMRGEQKWGQGHC